MSQTRSDASATAVCVTPCWSCWASPLYLKRLWEVIKLFLESQQVNSTLQPPITNFYKKGKGSSGISNYLEIDALLSIVLSGQVSPHAWMHVGGEEAEQCETAQRQQGQNCGMGKEPARVFAGPGEEDACAEKRKISAVAGTIFAALKKMRPCPLLWIKLAEQ